MIDDNKPSDVRVIPFMLPARLSQSKHRATINLSDNESGISIERLTGHDRLGAERWDDVDLCEEDQYCSFVVSPGEWASSIVRALLAQDESERAAPQKSKFTAMPWYDKLYFAFGVDQQGSIYDSMDVGKPASQANPLGKERVIFPPYDVDLIGLHIESFGRPNTIAIDSIGEESAWRAHFHPHGPPASIDFFCNPHGPTMIDFGRATPGAGFPIRVHVMVDDTLISGVVGHFIIVKK